MSQNYSLPDPIAVVDVETTGLSPWRHDRIVEIAIVMMSSDGRIHSEYESLVNPDRDMGPTRIHRISAAEVLHAPRLEECRDILDVLQRKPRLANIALIETSWSKNMNESASLARLQLPMHMPDAGPQQSRSLRTELVFHLTAIHTNIHDAEPPPISFTL
jgi:hypothetical protein